MKHHIALLLALVLALSLAACGNTPAEPTTPPETTLAPELPPETTTAPQAQILSGYVALADLLEGSTISLEVSGDTALLTQDGLTLTLTAESKLICRDGYVMGVQKKYTKLIDGQAYVYDGFAADFLPNDATGQASLFVNARFFPQEIIHAVENPSGSDFNRRVMEEVLLTPSMDIQIPHVDMDRVFSLTSLEEYSPELLQELGGLGYDTTRSYTYGEYQTLSYAQTLAQAKLSDDTQTTLGEYYAQTAQSDFQAFLDGLTEEEQAFAQTYDITDQDLNALLREFGDTLLTQTEETVRSALENYYQADLDYLAG